MSTLENPLWRDPQIVAGYRCIERITHPAGELLINQSGILLDMATLPIVLDNACGTGVISQNLYAKLNDAQKAKLKLTCSDLTSGMVEYMEHIIAAERWTGTKAETIDAQVSALILVRN